MKERDKNHLNRVISPAWLMFIIAAAIFVAEAVVMAILSLLPPLSLRNEVLFDATVLLLLLSPLLYYFGFRPLVLHIAERVRAEDALRDSEMRYRSVAQLGQRALANAGLSALLDEAAALVARTLDVTYCKVLELLPDGKALLLRAGAGWREGVMGQVTMGAVDSQAEYTLLSRNPVIVEDFSTETRFGVPPLLHDHDVVSGISVIIYDEGQPFGIMGAYTTEHRSFTQDDAHFLQAVANVLAEAIQRKRADDESRRSANKLAMLNQMLDQSNRELTTLYNTGSLLSATLDPDEISRVMFHQIIQPLLDVPHFTIALFDPETQTIFCRFAIIDGEEADVAQFPPFSLGEGPASDTIRTRQARIVDLEDIRPALEKRGRGVQIGDERRTKSALYVPMIAGDQAIGVMNVQSYAPNAFRGVDLAILTTIASQATVALENARLFAETQRYARELEAGIRQRRQAELELTRLYRASETLLSSAAPDTKTMAQSIVEIALREFGQSNCSLLLVNEGQSDLDRIAVAGPYTRDVVKGRLKLDGPGLVPKAIRLSRIINVSDVMDDPNYVPNWEAARSELAIPLKIGERVIGVIDVQSTEVSAFGPDDERLMSTFAEKAALALQTALLHEQTERSLQRLAALRNIDMTISGSLDLRITLSVLLEQVLTQLGVDAAAVLLLNPHLHTLVYKAGRGFRTNAVAKTHLRLGQGHAGRAALEGHTVHIPDLLAVRGTFSRAALLAEEGFAAYFGVPLIAKGQVEGILEIFHRAPLDPDPEWLDFLKALAGQAAIAIDNANLFEDLQRSNVELSLAYDATLEGWVRALDLRDEETEGHSRRVTELTVRLARAIGISETELVHVRRGALLHDIGKMGVSDSILRKPSKLTEEEWETMHQHPVYAYEMLSPIAFLRPALDIPRYHHERWDGAGYPQGLKEEQIPLVARIFAVVDVWDALRSDRPYRPAWPKEKTIEHIREQSGKHFDPRVVEAFLELVDREGREEMS